MKGFESVYHLKYAMVEIRSIGKQGDDVGSLCVEQLLERRRFCLEMAERNAFSADLGALNRRGKASNLQNSYFEQLSEIDKELKRRISR